MNLHDYLEQRRQDLFQELGIWIPHWRSIQEFISPRRGAFLQKNAKNKKVPRFSSIIDNTATMASRNLAAGMQAGVTSPARKWFALGLDDKDMAEFGENKVWLQAVSRLMYRIFAKSNFYEATHVSYGNLGDFGNAGMLIFPDYQNVIHCHQLPIGSFAIDINDKDKVDTVYRDIEMTVRNIVKQFGRKNLPRHIEDDYSRGNYMNRYTVRHAIEPNGEDFAEYKAIRRFPFASIFWVEGTIKEGFKPLRVSGFHEFPGMFPRWDLDGGDTYGTGPGSVAMGDTKQLQSEQREKGKAIAKMVNPPLQAPTSMQNRVVTTLPGGVNYHNSQASNNSDGVRPIYTVEPRLNEMREDIFEVQQRIKRGYYEDLFLMLTNDNRAQPPSATEVVERHEEKLLMLGPVLERQNNELLDAIIDRAFAIAERAKILPPAPDDIRDRDIEVEYISILAQAQKAVGVNAIESTVAFVGNLAGVKPDIVDKLDLDQAVDEYADMMGAPPSIVKSDDDVSEIRTDRASQEQALAQSQMAQEAAKTAELLSKTDTTGDNALADVLAGGMV
ncbi:MAG: portal protein [Candidatus Thiodiazotropha lotti]|nr:portal protein [Candidatus Thiodiazotropha lotti]MCW4221947.1 portal protein [Candidatus Thiodiazotropha lotti]